MLKMLFGVFGCYYNMPFRSLVLSYFATYCLLKVAGIILFVVFVCMAKLSKRFIKN
jgi:hypothetical protein